MKNKKLMAFLMAVLLAFMSFGSNAAVLQAQEADVIEEEAVYEEGADEAVMAEATNDEIAEPLSAADEIENLGVVPGDGIAAIDDDGTIVVNIGTRAGATLVVDADFELYQIGKNSDTLMGSESKLCDINNGLFTIDSQFVQFWLKDVTKGDYYVKVKAYEVGSHPKNMLLEASSEPFGNLAAKEKMTLPKPVQLISDTKIGWTAYQTDWPGYDEHLTYIIETSKDGSAKGITRQELNELDFSGLLESFGAGNYEFNVYVLSPNLHAFKCSNPATLQIRLPVGSEDPGQDEPGKDEPGKDEPGKDEPGKDEPGKDEPGQDEPGKEDEPARVEMFDLSKNYIGDIFPGDKFTITALVGPENAENRNVKWKVVDADNMDQPSDAVVLFTEDGVSANSLESGWTVTCQAIKAGKVRIIAYLESAPDWWRDCYCEIRYPENDGEVNPPYIAGGLKIYNVINESFEYDGTPMKFEDPNGNCYVQVYDKSNRRLVEKTDYTVSYANNINAGTGKVIITPIGDYAGDPVEVPFTIRPRYIAGINEETGEMDPWFSPSENLHVMYNGKEQKVVPVIRKNIAGKSVTLKGSTEAGKGDFTYSYPSVSADGRTAYKDCGEWEIKVTGNGNFAGETMVYESILSPEHDKLMSSLKITPEKKSYTYAELKANPVIKVKVLDGKEELDESYYDVEPLWDLVPGKNTVRIWGKDPGEGKKTYLGNKEITITVTAAKLTAAMVDFGNLQAQYTYTGEPVMAEGIKVNGSENGFSVKYDKNTNVGTGKVTVTGFAWDGYTGSVTKTFKIVPADISNWNVEVESELEDENQNVVYGKEQKPAISGKMTKIGATPHVNYLFREGYQNPQVGKDFTIKYINNKVVGKAGTIVITGKGNFKGSKIEIPFNVINSRIFETNIYAPDKAYNAKSATAWKSTPVLTDKNGKKLAAGKDYEKVVKYEYPGMDKVSIPTPGTVVTVIIQGKGAFAGSGSEPAMSVCYYKIIEPSKDISKATFSIKAKQFVGRNVPVELEKDDFIKAIAADKSTQLKFGTDYIITGYCKNTKKGKAQVTLKGQGEYGGTKTVQFIIEGGSFK